MTLEEAIDILNNHEHRGFNCWRPCTYEGQYGVSHGCAEDDFFTEFEAIAIATAYLNS